MVGTGGRIVNETPPFDGTPRVVIPDVCRRFAAPVIRDINWSGGRAAGEAMKEIKERLAEELRLLERELRIELPKEIRTAVAMGDLRENAEYRAALERQSFVKARIGQLRERLATISSIHLSQIPRDRVGLGSRVLLEDLDNGEEVRYELVFPEMANLETGLISIASPIGKGLVGLREGDVAKVAIPSGRKRFEVVELETIHAREGSD